MNAVALACGRSFRTQPVVERFDLAAIAFDENMRSPTGYPCLGCLLSLI